MKKIKEITSQELLDILKQGLTLDVEVRRYNSIGYINHQFYHDGDNVHESYDHFENENCTRCDNDCEGCQYEDESSEGHIMSEEEFFKEYKQTPWHFDEDDDWYMEYLELKGAEDGSSI